MNMLTVDDLCFEVRRSAARRTLEITVDRSGELILSAPAETPEVTLRDFVQRKRMWIYQQLARLERALRELPPTPYEYAAWKRCRVNLDYHVEIEKHFYSVPFRLLREEVEARITAKTVEIFHRGKLVATHLRSLRQYRPTTTAEHMPSSHRRYRDWTHERIMREAAAIGDDTAALVEIVLHTRPHPEQGFRSCIGILGLAKRYDGERLDAACARALGLGTRSYSSVAAILKNAQDRKPAEPEQPSLLHENIRGPGYYH